MSAIGKIGYGCMNLTWKPTVTPDEQAFKAIKTALDSPDCKMLNTGTFYAQDMGPANLTLLRRFFEAHPEYKDKAYISVKGFGKGGDYESLLKDMSIIKENLGMKPALFECARVDKSAPIEETIKNLAKLVQQGYFDHIGLSECSAETIRRAAAVHKIAAVEVEYSLWAFDIEKNGVLEACRELGIPVVAYSPIGRGMLSGKLKSPEDLPKGDHRHDWDRFQKENFDQNLKVVRKIEDFAKKKDCTPAELCVAWLMAQSTDKCPIIPIPGSTRPEGVAESLRGLEIKLTEAESKELHQIASSVDIIGGRYNKDHEHMLEG